MPLLKDITGAKVGRLTVVRRVDNFRGKVHWLCKCECGNETEVCSDRLLHGTTKSCGCLHRERASSANADHGLSSTRQYSIWRGMKDRTSNEKCESYPRYGGRGVKMCEEWLNSFEAFYEWANSNGYSDVLTIDRVDGSKGYSPDNCRWITPYENAINKPNLQSNNTSGFRGVSYMRSKNKWRARVNYLPMFGDTEVHIGLYDTAEEAHAARLNFIEKYKIPYNY